MIIYCKEVVAFPLNILHASPHLLSRMNVLALLLLVSRSLFNTFILTVFFVYVLVFAATFLPNFGALRVPLQIFSSQYSRVQRGVLTLLDCIIQIIFFLFKNTARI